MAADAYIWTGEEGKEDMAVLDQLVDNEEMTPEQAVEKTIRLAHKPRSHPSPLATHCSATTGGIIAAAARTAPERQSKLVAYVHELRSKTVVDPKTGKAYEHDGQALWKDLPTFGYTVADELHSIPGKLSTETRLSFDTDAIRPKANTGENCKMG
jgi:hypothetical protein